MPESIVLILFNSKKEREGKGKERNREEVGEQKYSGRARLKTISPLHGSQ